jgi:hypothetical protein
LSWCPLSKLTNAEAEGATISGTDGYLAPFVAAQTGVKVGILVLGRSTTDTAATAEYQGKHAREHPGHEAVGTACIMIVPVDPIHIAPRNHDKYFGTLIIKKKRGSDDIQLV